MPEDGLDLIIVDDDPLVCEFIYETIKRFYTWGDIYYFTNPEEATAFCEGKEVGIAIFILDVFMGEKNAFTFLDSIADKFPMACEDCIIITGNASNDVVNMCVSSDITCLLEKPIRAYALQMAVRTIVTKYVRFVKRILKDADFAESVKYF